MAENINFPSGGLPRVPADFQVVSLDDSYLAEMLGLQELSIGSLKDKMNCVSLSKDELREILGERGIALGVIKKEKLIAFYCALFPGNTQENLGHDLELSGKELEQVCHLEIAFVHPDYRGEKLQLLLGHQVVSRVRAMGKHRYFCVTVAPQNCVSLKNTLSLGVHIVELKKKYQGQWRFILFNDLKEPIKLDRKNPVTASNTDYAFQRQLLLEGYAGFQQVKRSGQWEILYGKRWHV